MEEIWKPVTGYEGLYEVSNLGRVKSVERWVKRSDGHKNHILERIIKVFPQNSGYLQVGLHKNGAVEQFLVHRLVAETFIPNPENHPQVNHKDETKENNTVFVKEDGTVDQERSNLEWCDQSYNNNYGTIKERWGAKRKNRPDMSKKVLQCTLDGTVIATYPSTVEAERQTGVKCQCVGQCCLGRQKTAGGFKWRYADVEKTDGE